MNILRARLITAGMTVAAAFLVSCAKRVQVERYHQEYPDHVSALTNVLGFARTPLGNAHLETTYDRTGGNEDWSKLTTRDADGLYTVVDIQGAGCIKRIWQTNIRPDAYLFFFDGEKEARLRLTWEDLFGETPPFDYPLAAAPSGGDYTYMPIPFRKSLRLAMSLPDSFTSGMGFYHINYETYPRSVETVSFPRNLGVETRKLVDRVREVWTDQENEAKRAMTTCEQKVALVVQPGQNTTWLHSKHGGLLRAFWIRPDNQPALSPVARARRLRELVLRFYWDGEQEPSVDVPLGDFFCNGLHRRKFASLPISVLDSAFVCRFPMPFRSMARAEIRNDGQIPVNVEIGYDLEEVPTDMTKAVNYFHACWKSSMSPGTPHPVLAAKGKGHYVGCYLIDIGTDGTWNMLESDEVIYLNGEPAGSMHGTGMEDYFNGGWYYRGLFEFPLHGLVEKAAMRTAQYRFHLTDAIRFDTGFLMNWEFGRDARNMGRGYMSSVAYWYQPEPNPAGTRMLPVAERFPAFDRTEPATVMSGLFELERIGHYKEAAERCEFYAERLAGSTMAPVLLLRATAYRELTDGFEAVRGSYQAIEDEYPRSAAAQQARALRWYHESTSNALLAAHTSMRAKIYLDGRPLGESADPRARSLSVFPVTLGPGEHEIVAEITPLYPSPWFSCYLRSHATNVVMEGTWECSQTRPVNWPRTDDSAAAWAGVEHTEGSLPKMAWWQFEPNGFVGMQSGKTLESAWTGWDKQPFRTTYLRKRFTLPPQTTP